MRVQVTPTGLIIVWIDFHDGNGMKQVLHYQDPTSTVPQADMDSGQVFNSATATATSPNGGISSQPATVTIPTDSHPGPITLTKTGSVTGTGPGGSVVAGDVVHYSAVGGGVRVAAVITGIFSS